MTLHFFFYSVVFPALDVAQPTDAVAILLPVSFASRVELPAVI